MIYHNKNHFFQSIERIVFEVFLSCSIFIIYYIVARIILRISSLSGNIIQNIFQNCFHSTLSYYPNNNRLKIGRSPATIDAWFKNRKWIQMDLLDSRDRTATIKSKQWSISLEKVKSDGFAFQSSIERARTKSGNSIMPLARIFTSFRVQFVRYIALAAVTTPSDRSCTP